MKDNIPFALLYAETVQTKSNRMETIYDEAEDLNMVEIDDRMVPIAMMEQNNLGTKTFTAVKPETTDEDLIGCNMMLKTSTITEIRREETDADLSEDYREINLGTQTVTKEWKENTDSD